MEVQIFSQLDHPNIVKYYESFKEGNDCTLSWLDPASYLKLSHLPWLSQSKFFLIGSLFFDHFTKELVEGVTLLDFIKSTSEKNERISEESIWDIFIQIVLALNYIHIVKGWCIAI